LQTSRLHVSSSFLRFGRLDGHALQSGFGLWFKSLAQFTQISILRFAPVLPSLVSLFLLEVFIPVFLVLEAGNTFRLYQPLSLQ